MAEKKAEGRPEQLAQSGQVSPQTTAERLGEEYGVSKNTIRRNADFAEAVDKIEKSEAPRGHVTACWPEGIRSRPRRFERNSGDVAASVSGRSA